MLTFHYSVDGKRELTLDTDLCDNCGVLYAYAAR